MPECYNRSKAAENVLGVQNGECFDDLPFHEKNATNGGPSFRDLKRYYTESIKETNAGEVLFAGCHCGTYCFFDVWFSSDLLHPILDVGGGSVANGTRHSLARIPLRWMIGEYFKTNTGILFHSCMFKQIGCTLMQRTARRPFTETYHYQDGLTAPECPAEANRLSGC